MGEVSSPRRKQGQPSGAQGGGGGGQRSTASGRRAGAKGGDNQTNGSARRPTDSRSTLEWLGERVSARERLGPQSRPRESSNRRPRERVAAPVEKVGNSGGLAPRGSLEVRAPAPTGAERVIGQLRSKVEELEKKVEVRDHSPEPVVRMAAPFTLSIMAAPLPKDFRLPAIKAYTGSSDPCVHMTQYKAAIMMIGADDAIMCRGFLVPTHAGRGDTGLVQHITEQFDPDLCRADEKLPLLLLRQHPTQESIFPFVHGQAGLE